MAIGYEPAAQESDGKKIVIRTSRFPPAITSTMEWHAVQWRPFFFAIDANSITISGNFFGQPNANNKSRSEKMGKAAAEKMSQHADTAVPLVASGERQNCGSRFVSLVSLNGENIPSIGPAIYLFLRRKETTFCFRWLRA